MRTTNNDFIFGKPFKNTTAYSIKKERPEEFSNLSALYMEKYSKSRSSKDGKEKLIITSKNKNEYTKKRDEAILKEREERKRNKEIFKQKRLEEKKRKAQERKRMREENRKKKESKYKCEICNKKIDPRNLEMRCRKHMTRKNTIRVAISYWGDKKFNLPELGDKYRNSRVFFSRMAKEKVEKLLTFSDDPIEGHEKYIEDTIKKREELRDILKTIANKEDGLNLLAIYLTNKKMYKSRESAKGILSKFMKYVPCRVPVSVKIHDKITIVLEEVKKYAKNGE
jgi:hypothetical protein